MSDAQFGSRDIFFKRLATISGIDFKTQTQTDLFVIPAGKTLILTDVILRATNVVSFGSVPSVRVGIASSYNEFIGTTSLTSFDATDEYVSLARWSTAQIHKVISSTAGTLVGGVYWTNSNGSSCDVTITRNDGYSFPPGLTVFYNSASSSGSNLFSISLIYANGTTISDINAMLVAQGYTNLVAAGGAPSLANSASEGPTTVPANSTGGNINTLKLDVTTGASATTFTGEAHVLGFLI